MIKKVYLHIYNHNANKVKAGTLNAFAVSVSQCGTARRGNQMKSMRDVTLTAVVTVHVRALQYNISHRVLH